MKDSVKLLRLSGENASSLALTLTERLLHLHAILVFIAALQALQFGFDIAVLASGSDCGFLSKVEGPSCADELDLVQRAGTIFTAIVLVVLLLQLFRKVRNVAAYQTYRLPRFLAAWLERWFPMTKRADWVAAGSPDLYAETLSSISQTSKLSGMLILPFAITCTAVRAASLIYAFVSGISTHPADEMCDGSSLCLFAQSFGPVFTSWGHYTVLLVYLHVNIYRPGIWSAIMDLAAKRNGSTRIQHIMWLPVTCLLTFCVGAFIALYLAFCVNDFHASSSEVIGLFFVQIFYALSGTFLILLARIPQDIVKCMSVRIRHLARRFSKGSEDQVVQVCSRGASAAPKFRDDGSGHLKEILLFANVVVWLEHVPLTRTPLALVVAAFAYRLLLLLLILRSRQQPARFEDIEKSPCFGLVIDAHVLRRILYAYVNGKPPPSGGDIPMYKGTLHRMGETLAVSYRWQDEEAELAPGISLNMSMYQIKAVLTALNSFRYRYVWLDRLSVPQDDHPLKFTLLARMMAVYTAAKATLAIRTIEESGSRYHERAWTCQEFVVARRLVIATQESGPEDNRSARSPECDTRMAALRKRVRMQNFVPLWLRANSGTSAVGKVTEISRADGEFILSEFYSLSNYLSCTFAGDRLRALLPLVSCAPLEDHQELVSLVLAISKATGKDLLDWKESLLKQHQNQKRIMQNISRRFLTNPTPGEDVGAGGVCVPWWGGDSPTTEDDALAGTESEFSSSMSVPDPWQVWKPKSSFRARVTGVVSQESVLENCNQLRGLAMSRSVTGATTALSGQEFMAVPHSKTKKQNSVKRNSIKRGPSRTTISGVSEASSSPPGPSRANTFTRKSSTLSNNTPVSVSAAASSLLLQQTDQGAQHRAPAKQKSHPSRFSWTSSANSEQSTPENKPSAMSVCPSHPQEIMSDAVQRRPPAKRASRASVFPEPPASGLDHDAQTDQRELQLPPRQNTMGSSAPPEDPTSDDPKTLLLAKKRVTFSSALHKQSPSGHDGDDQADQEARQARPSRTRRGSLFSGLSSALSMSSSHPEDSSADKLQRQILGRRVSIASALLEPDDDDETDQGAPGKRDSFFAMLTSTFSVVSANDEESNMQNRHSFMRPSHSRFAVLPESLPSGTDNAETDQGAGELPSKQDSLFSLIASVFSPTSSHNDESPPEGTQPTASAVPQDAPETLEKPLSGSNPIGAVSMDTMAVKPSLASKASDGNVHMAAAADASPATPMLRIDDDPSMNVPDSSNWRRERTVRRCVSQITSPKTNEDSQGFTEVLLPPSNLGVVRKQAPRRGPSLPSLQQPPPVPASDPNPGQEAKRVSARALLPALPQSSDRSGPPAARGAWNLFGRGSRTPKKTSVASNDSTLPRESRPDSVVIDMPGSRATSASGMPPTAHSSSSAQSFKESLAEAEPAKRDPSWQAGASLPGLAAGSLFPHDGKTPYDPNSDFASDIRAMGLGIRTNYLNGLSSPNKDLLRLGREELRRISEADYDEELGASFTMKRFLEDAAKHSGKVFE